MRRCSCVTSGATARLILTGIAASFLLSRALDGLAAPRSDHVLFAVLAIGLGVRWARYRRDPSPEAKIRFAALAALVSVVLLSVTAAMPWVVLDAGSGGAHVLCLLGQEGACAARAGAPPLIVASEPATTLQAFEVQRWLCASAALRMGQVMALSLLLPALIWLLVDPRHRAAQAATAVGASVAGFTLLVVFLYRASVPAWLDGELTWTADIALLAAGAIVVASVLIVRQSFALIGDARGLPRAALATPPRAARFARDRASAPRS